MDNRMETVFFSYQMAKEYRKKLPIFLFLDVIISNN